MISLLVLEFVVITVVAAYACLVWLGREQLWRDRHGTVQPQDWGGLTELLMIAYLAPVLTAAAVVLGTLIGCAVRFISRPGRLAPIPTPDQSPTWR